MSNVICDELIDKIFIRLPLKSILRFRCLSKPWYARIVSSDFIRMHALRSVNNPQKVLIRHQNYLNRRVRNSYTLHYEDQLPLSDGGEEYKGITPIEFPDNDFDIIGSCNGLVCLIGYQIGITLWNPSIRHKLTVPSCPLRDFSDDSSVAVGFGFDLVTNDYKIVKVVKMSYTTNFSSISSVYSMNTRAWRDIPPPATLLDSYLNPYARFVNGALHWLVKDYEDQRCIMAFDLSTEIFGMIRLPGPRLEVKQLTVISCSLAIVTNEYWDIQIWLMKEYNNATSWCPYLKFNIPYGLTKYRNLQVTTNGDLLLIIDCHKGYIVYNPAKEVHSRLVKFKVGSLVLDVETYVENLVLLNIGTACHGI